jgi:type VI secretion system protein ImpK
MASTTPDDPFAEFDAGRTFILPTPGGRAGVAAGRAAQSTTVGAPEVAADIGVGESGLNPLVALANPLLALVPQVRATTQLADPAALRDAMAHGLREFETRARARNIAPERVLAARYILCTLLDEVAAGMPWGAAGQWGRHSLLAMFHNETGGGQKVFQLMAKLAENPAANRDLLELIYAALCLGFEGRYRVVDGGRAQLEAVRERLAQIIAKERGAYAPALAQNWAGVSTQRRAMLGWLPLWVTLASLLLLLALAYAGLSRQLNAASDPVYRGVLELSLAPPMPAVKIAAPKPRLAQFLANEIKAQLITVRDEVDRSVITVRGDGLFAPASATLSTDRETLMMRLAAALAQVGGAVLVTGHTDSTPIRTALYPSNWHLSEERAKSVKRLLVDNGVVAERVSAEGRADGEPVAANDSAANRALNRRVEITVFIARPVPATAQASAGRS